MTTGAGLPTTPAVANPMLKAADVTGGYGSVQILNPSSAPTTISGRVVTANGRTIGDATVTVTDENGAAYSARTSSFGHFVIDRVPSGRTYVLSTRAKKYTFANSVLSVTAAIDGLVIQPER